MTIAEVKEASDDTPVLTSGTVMAKYARGFIITDGTENLLVFQGSNPSSMPKIGDVVTVSGTRDTYSGLAQIGGTVEFEVTSSETITYPDSYPSPAVYEGSAFNGIGNDLGDVEFIQYTGELVKDGNYYNVSVGGATLEGGVTYPDSDLQNKLNGLVGKEITVTGYYLGLTNGKQTVSTMAVDLAEASPSGGETFSVSPLSLNVSAEGGTTKFSVEASDNVAWTITTTDDVHLTVISGGTGSKEVTLMYRENEGPDAKTADIIVSTTADVPVKSYTIKFKQSAPGATARYYVKVTSEPADWSGKYLIVYESDDATGYVFDGSLSKLDAVKNYKEFAISGGQIESTAETDAVSFTVGPQEDGWSVLAANGQYICQTANSNGLRATDTPEKQNLAVDTDQSTKLSDAKSGCVLRFNNSSDQMRFRYYKPASYTGQKAIALYKLSE